MAYAQLITGALQVLVWELQFFPVSLTQTQVRLFKQLLKSVLAHGLTQLLTLVLTSVVHKWLLDLVKKVTIAQ